MKLNMRKVFSFVFFSLIFLPYISLILPYSDPTSDYNSNTSEVKLNQPTNNYSIDSKFRSLIWIEAHLTLKIESNQSGVIRCVFTENTGRTYFTVINRSVEILGTNETQIIQLVLKAHITTLPGKYNFTLNIGGIFDYMEQFKAILGMGYLLLITILIIFVLGIILIIRKTRSSEKIKNLSLSRPEPLLERTDDEIVNKIKCPECKRLIDEGLIFCPECGSRIPEFLRFNPNSPSG